MATELPSVENGGISQDGLVYTFKLREDVTWSDGKKVTAGDFAYSIKRLLDPTIAARYSTQLWAIKGAQEYGTAVEADDQTRQTLRDAVAAEAVDDRTLRITLARPDPTLLQKMALPFSYPVRQDIVDEFGVKWTEAGNYIGNGPYVMTEWAHQDHITLAANAGYWGTKPKLATITLLMIGDPNAALAAYRNDELHFSDVPPGTESSIAQDSTLGQEVVRAPKLSTIGLFFNMAEAPFDNLKVRQAFATAIDRQTWIDKVKSGVGKPATSWLPPGMPGYDPALGREFDFQPERARQLLADAGFPGGEGLPPISFTFVALQDQPVIAQFIQAQLKEHLGVDVTLEPLDPPTFFQQVVGGHQFQITSVGWSADYPDPESFLAPLFMTGSGNNISQYSSPEFDQLAGQASSELSREARIGLWRQAHAIMVKDVPVAFFFYEERFFLKKAAVQGVTLTGIDGAVPGDTRLDEVSLTR